MDKKRKNKILKWDEVVGVTFEENTENYGIPDEVDGAVLSLSKNPMRSIEDMIEQNDNCLDGVINNMPEPKPVTQMTNEDVVNEEQAKKSILMRLQEGALNAQRARQVPGHGLCCELERT